MNDPTVYYNDKKLRIVYSPAMDGYWVVAKGKHYKNEFRDFIDIRAFQDLKNSDNVEKLLKLRTLDSNVLQRINESKISPMTLCNAIEIVKIKEEIEYEKSIENK